MLGIMKKLALNNSNTAGMSDVFKSGNTLRCSSAKVHSSCKGLLFIFLEQNGTSSSLLLMDAVMTNNNEAYCKGTSPGAANPCHKTFLRFRLEGGPIKMHNNLITVSPNTSFSSDVASKSFSNDGQCDESEYER